MLGQPAEFESIVHSFPLSGPSIPLQKVLTGTISKGRPRERTVGKGKKDTIYEYTTRRKRIRRRGKRARKWWVL